MHNLIEERNRDQDARGGHSSSDDGGDDAPNDAPCGPCSSCVGCFCKEEDSVRESPGGSHTRPYSQSHPTLQSPPACLPPLPRADDILFIHLILIEHLLCDRMVNKTCKSGGGLIRSVSNVVGPELPFRRKEYLSTEETEPRNGLMIKVSDTLCMTFFIILFFFYFICHC